MCYSSNNSLGTHLQVGGFDCMDVDAMIRYDIVSLGIMNAKVSGAPHHERSEVGSHTTSLSDGDESVRTTDEQGTTGLMNDGGAG